MTIINQDTIVALATPAGGAIGIIRMSGSQAISIAAQLFVPAKKSTILAQSKGNTLYYGFLKSLQGKEIDEVMLSVYRNPYSYTGEDCIEISCHGSSFILQSALNACIEAGARQAAPGEFTQRAYLNGKMDLSQAEAVADLIASTNKASHRLALSQLKGHFSNDLAKLRDQLLKLTSLIELELDFSDHEDLEFADREELSALANQIHDHIASLAHSFEMGNALKEGVPVAIIGKTNVGKSTLLNRLLHEEKAIVSDIHGTTRDVIEDTIDINGVTFRLIDTAGIRETNDTIERIGIKRAMEKLEEAQIVLWLVDDSTYSSDELDEITKHTQDKNVVLIHNKSDLNTNQILHSPIPLTFQPFEELSISAKYNHGIKELEQVIYQAAALPEIDENSVLVTNVRHYQSLTHALSSIDRVLDGLDMNLSGDLLAEDLRICLEDLAEITGGAITPQETLQNIFHHFCIGK